MIAPKLAGNRSRSIHRLGTVLYSAFGEQKKVPTVTTDEPYADSNSVLRTPNQQAGEAESNPTNLIFSKNAKAILRSNPLVVIAR